MLHNSNSSRHALGDDNRMGRHMTSRKPDHQRRVLRTKKRPQDLEKIITLKRPNVRILSKKPTHRSTNIADYDDGIYIPEFQKMESWEDKYFKIKIPGTDTIKLLEKIARLEKEHEGKIPRPILQDVLRPRLKHLAKDLDAKGEEFKLHLFELWKMEDVWTFPVDNAFAASFFTQIEQMCRMTSASHLCTRCTSICLDKSMGVRGHGRSMRSCGLCKILAQPRLNVSYEAQMLKSDRQSLFRICAAPGWSTRYL